MQETQVQSLVQEDPLEKGMATHSNILAWKIPSTEEPSSLQSTGSQRAGHDQVTKHARVHAPGQNKLKKFKNWSLLTGSSFYTISLIRFRSKFTVMNKRKIGSKEHLHLRFKIWYLFKTRLVGSVHPPYFPSCLHIQISRISLLMLEIPLSRNREMRGPRDLLQNSLSHERQMSSRSILTQWQSTTVRKPRPCTYYDSYYRSILNLTLDTSRWGVEGNRGQEEISWLTQKGKNGVVSLLE